MRFHFFKIFFIICFAALLMNSCAKDDFTTNSESGITFSKDTIRFDTVFVSSGSVTQTFKIYNNNNQKIRISQIRLMGGNGSSFQININGIPSSSTSNFDLDAEDSAYVFVTVNIDPNQQKQPFLIQDSIRFDCNGNTSFVQLEAYGQNAVFVRNSRITSDVTWNDSLPYVIIGPLIIDSNATLELLPGCRIFVHANAPILIDGSLQSMGTEAEPVIIRGDRMDEYYKGLPGSWAGLYFRPSSQDNQMAYTRLLNATDAINLISPSPNSTAPKLTLRQCIIDNALRSGIYAIESSFIATNCLISNCGNNINIEKGGEYDLEHCTIVAYSNSYVLHQEPVLEASDYALLSGTGATSDLSMIIKNSILWGEGGSILNEIRLDKAGNGIFDVRLENCILRNESDSNYWSSINLLRNIDPLFDSVDTFEEYYDFRTLRNPSAPGIDQGSATLLPKDLDGLPRTVNGTPDLGCYEKQ